MPERLPVPGQYAELEHCYLMGHWPGVRRALAAEEARLRYWTQKYHEAAPLRAQYGITASAPPKHGSLYYRAKKALASYDYFEALDQEIRSRRSA